MRYVVLGAGAVGSAIGGLLAHDAGCDVVLVSRGDHARVMLEHGLTVRCPDSTFTQPIGVATSDDQVILGVDDVLVLTTKTHQAETVLNEWADVPVRDVSGRVVGRAADTLPVFTACNGVSSEQIALRYFARVFAVCVWFPAVMMEPGEVVVRGAPHRGVFHMGRYPRPVADAADCRLLRDVAHDWDTAGCLVRRPEAVMEWKYRKLITNLGNIIQALLGDTNDADDVRRDAEHEARAVLRASNRRITPDAEAQTGWQPPGLVFQPVPGEPAQLGGSTWQSFIRGTGTIETDFLNGEIVRIARCTGQTAPINARLTALARHAARQGLQPGATSPAQLRTFVRSHNCVIGTRP